MLFIDEIHRLSRAVEEILYPAMEDFQLDIVVGKGPAASSIRLTLPPLHARRGDDPDRDDHRPAARPLRARRPARLLRPRRAAGDRRPCRRHPRRAASTTTARGRSPGGPRGTPRIANRLLRRVRDFAEVRGDGRDRRRRRRARPHRVRRRRARARQGRPGDPRRPVRRSSAAGPVGLSTLAISVGEQPETVEDVYEPFLIQQGLIARTPRGRVAMPRRSPTSAWPCPTRPGALE